MRHGNQPLVAVSRKHFDPKDRGWPRQRRGPDRTGSMHSALPTCPTATAPSLWAAR
jgi:hypothetical protein